MRCTLAGIVALSLILPKGADAQNERIAERLRTIEGPTLDSLRQELVRVGTERGERHADLLPILFTIRDAYLEHGATVSALPYMERALEVTEAVSGADDGVTLTAVNNLSGLYLMARDHDRALAQTERLRSTVERMVGTEHPAFAEATVRHAEARLRAGDFAAAEAQFQMAIAVLSSVMGPAAHELTEPIMLNAEASLRLGQVARAEQPLQYGLAIRSGPRL
jgi:hypothetical protein